MLRIRNRTLFRFEKSNGKLILYYSTYIEECVKNNDTESIIRIYRDILLKAYGIKSEDGRRFIKSEEISKEFSQTEAFSELFMELALDQEASKEFMRGLTPTKQVIINVED